ncbi:MAG TPA: NADH-quinone oxidoreductase subunit L [Bryobacteraceae bacterium]|nr:NADH-quinone oxidoreductase subunit L [Bryobacteraceae bacterium]
MDFLNSIWLIPLFPLLGAVVMLLLGKKLDPQAPSDVAVAEGVPRNAVVEHHAGHQHLQEPDTHHVAGGHHHHGSPSKFLISLLCPGMVLLSFIFSLGAVIQLAAKPEKVHQLIQFTWMAGLPFVTDGGTLARFAADWGFLLDPLSSVMILVVTGIGFLIHVYSIGYMGHEGGYYRFFGYLNLFVFFMLMLVLANNYLLLFVGWEGVGLCSYLLIGFYFHKKSAADAGKKAFIVNRIGDAGFILGMLLLFSVVGTLRFTDVNAALAHMQPEVTFGILSAIALFLFIGATGKSAQFPLYVWLPDAMEGPTPVSALIHAATMVTAGVYMVARSNVLFRLTPETSTVVAAIGAFTAIFAASIALTQNDIKRVLAYSTVSQLGFMFMAAGVGAYWVAVFHLYTHAFFKALLFLGSGSVIHAMGGEQDMRKMGALRKKIPITHATMLIGTLAIAGVPGLAGFFSKDEILWQAWSNGFPVVYVVGIVTACLTAFYMWRLMALTFYGESRVAPGVHVHESPKSMTVPLMVLAAGSVAAGWIGMPKVFPVPEVFRTLEHWLAPVLIAEAHGGEHGAHDASLEWLLMGLSVAVAGLGIFIAYTLYQKRRFTKEPLEALGPFYKGSLGKWYVDEIYDLVLVNGLSKGGGAALWKFDATVVDGGVNGAGWLTRASSTITMWWDTWIIDGAVRLSSFLVKLASYPVRIVQTGSVQAYAFMFVLGVVAFLGYYVTR